MAVPARPVSGEPIDSTWGQLVHDEVVARELQSGRVSVTLSNAVTAQLAVSFSPAFASAPQVVVTAESSAGTHIAGITGLGLSGFTIVVFRRDGANVVNDVFVNWMANGQRA